MRFMSESIYLNCDFSGIQDYVLGIKAAGKAQAKRLRARSFLLELFERAALTAASRRFDISEDNVFVSGGGNFLVRLPGDTDSASLDELLADLQRRLWEETNSEVHVSMGWGADPEDARAHLELQKRRPGGSLLQQGTSWDPAYSSLPPLGDPCDICGQSPGVSRVTDDDGEELHCRACLKARRIGQNLTSWEWMCPSGSDPGPLEALGVHFENSIEDRPGAFRVGRWVPQHENRDLLTFEEIAEHSSGVNRLGVLKADVDDMGVRVGEIARADPSLKQLQAFSAGLQTFFGDRLQGMLRQRWPSMYTIYSGGDDLLLVGPWDVTFDFAGALIDDFEEGPGREYGITLSAGISLSPFRVPVRRAVDRAEELLDAAKGREGKGSCAALGAIWKWERHRTVVQQGKSLAEWARHGAASRSLLQRLLNILESRSQEGAALREARWTYQVHRNTSASGGAAPEFRNWALGAFYRMQDREQVPKEGDELDELAAILRYSLLSTRPRER